MLSTSTPVITSSVTSLTEDKHVDIKYASTHSQIADALTKPLPFLKFTPFRDRMLGLLPNSEFQD